MAKWHGWLGDYARFLWRVGYRNPLDLLKNVVPWTLYSLGPMLTRRSVSRHIFPCSDVDGAVHAFRRDGFVVLSDGLSLGEVAKLKRIVTQKAENILRLDEAGIEPAWKQHGFRRYSYGEYGHSPEWEYLGLNEKVLPILKGIWQGHDFRAVGAGW